MLLYPYEKDSLAMDVINTGGSNLNFGAITITGDFTQTNTWTTLNLRAACNVGVTFGPTT